MFELKVGDMEPKQITVQVANSDVNGLPLYPLGLSQLTGTASIEFDLASSPNAVDVLVTVKKPDGRNLPATVCKASPCTIPADARQKDHLYQLAFRDAAGQILSTTEWIPLTVSQTDSQPVYAANGGETWNKFGFYLMQNWPNWIGSKGKRQVRSVFRETDVDGGRWRTNGRRQSHDVVAGAIHRRACQLQLRDRERSGYCRKVWVEA